MTVIDRRFKDRHHARPPRVAVDKFDNAPLVASPTLEAYLRGRGDVAHECPHPACGRRLVDWRCPEHGEPAWDRGQWLERAGR